MTVSGVLHSTVYGYDANGNQTTVTDWRENTSTNVYDPLNRLIEKRDPYGTIQKLEYYKNNLQSKSYDALGNLTTFNYDRNGRLVSTTGPEGHVTGQAYDDAGNVLTKTDGRNIATTYNYDEFNRLKSVVNAKGETTSYTYDLNGNMLTQTDGNGNTTVFQYNVANKPIKKIDPNGAGNPKKTESYTYDADGSMKSKVDRNGKTTYYEYDIHGRLLSQTIDGNAISYTYDDNGNQLTMTDSTGTTARTYDALDRVLAKQAPNMGTTSFRYDITTDIEAGCTGEQSTDPKGNITLKEYDKVGRLYKVTADGGTTTYAYYPTGSRQSVTYPDGTKEEYTYTDDNLLRELKNKKADGSVMDDYTYTYDAAHNQLSKHELVNGIDKGTTSYTYDSLNRLETVTEPGKATSYTFDKAGNRLSETVTAGGQTVVTTYTYNEQNRLMNTITRNGDETERVKYIYDNNGNMLAKDRAVTTSIPSGSIPAVTGYRLGQATENYSTIYRYDVWNQLMKTVEADKTVTYSYNGEGYRVEKSVNGSLTRYLYESDKVVLETDASGNQTARNVYGTNLITRTTGGQTAFYLYNGHADVTALISPNGSVLASYRYDAWGTVIEENENPGVENPYRYAGYRYESETGLYYLNARYYDSKIARFLSEDTYRGQASDPLSLNLYTYCINNPIIYYDPTGHLLTETEQQTMTQEGKDLILMYQSNWNYYNTEMNKYKIGSADYNRNYNLREQQHTAADNVRSDPSYRKPTNTVNTDGSTNPNSINTSLPGTGTYTPTNPGSANAYGATSKEFNPAIRDAQICLSSMNYSIGNAGYDGLIGASTKAAVLNFQKKFANKYGLSPTGQLDEATLRAIQQEAVPSLIKENEEFKEKIADSGSLLSKTDYVLVNPKYYIDFLDDSQSGIDPVFAGRLAHYAKDKQLVFTVSPNGGKRDYEDQVKAYKESGGYQDSQGNWVGGNGRAAVPGVGWHEFGEAVDTRNISIKDLYGDWASTKEQKKLTDYGIFKPLTAGNGIAKGKRENWHLQPIETEYVKISKRYTFYDAYK